MSAEALEVAGWDIGGVNVKAARLTVRAGDIVTARSHVHPFEIWRRPRQLTTVLRQVAGALGIDDDMPMAVTMTAELSDAFRTKREGVLAVIDGVRCAFPAGSPRVLDTAGDLVTPQAARRRPLDFAATNWVASALFAAERRPDCVLVDVGSTTTDIIPIREGRIAAEGRADVARLAAGELVYSGVLRTNPATLVATVPLRGRSCRVAAESFTQMADVYLLLGRLAPDDYMCSTADGRGAGREEARERLARLVCADAETLAEEETLKLARYLAERQLRQVTDGLLQVLSRQPDAYSLPVAPAGAGAFLAAEAGQRLGLSVLEPDEVWRGVEHVALPAGAVAALLARRLAAGLP